MIEVDYIIVGQGLAGSAVAVQLLQRGKKIFVIDELNQNTSSRIAAGLFNPVTGQNSVKTWMADTIFPYLEIFYRNVEKATNSSFFFSRPLYRPFGSVEEQNEWMARSADLLYSPFLYDIFSNSQFQQINDPLGGLMLKWSGFLNTTVYLAAVRDWIAQTCFIRNGHFDYDSLEFAGESVVYGEVTAKKIIFCQGERSYQNKWFGKVPIRPLKGETLLIKIDWKTDLIINRGVYMVPGNAPGEFRIGSTYKYNDRSPGITETGLKELKQKLGDLIQIPFEVSQQDWGVRPTTIDRRPILGCHPEFENLVIFNGLGTKGVSLAPYFSDVLIRWLESHEPLNKEVSVARYK